MAIKVVLNLNTKENLVQEYKRFLEENLPNVRNYSGCQSVNVFFNTQTNEMSIDEIWSSKEHHSKYIQFISQNGVMAKLASFLSCEPEIKYYDILEL